MTGVQKGLSTLRYLRLNRSLQGWPVLVYSLAICYGTYLRTEGKSAELLLLVCLFAVPIAAGTGVLTSARRGMFDLLLGSGVSRHYIVVIAYACVVILPAALAASLFPFVGMTTPHDLAEGALRAATVVVFTGGLGFAVGAVELRYTLGVVWMLVRFLFGFSEPIRQTIFALGHPEAGVTASRPMIAATMFIVPETIVDRIPILFVLVAGLFGLLASIAAWGFFVRADLTGKAA